MIEVELKFEIAPGSSAQLERTIVALPAARLLSRSENTDVYYDTTHFDCLRQAMFIRIRNHTRLEIKYHESADPLHTHSTERVFPLQASPDQLAELNALCSRFIVGWRAAGDIAEAICINGLTAFASIEKRRTQYACENIVLCIDQVKDLGDFFEIETQRAEEAQADQASAELNRFVAALAFPYLEPVQVGYVELWLRRYLPEAYRLGKYLAEATADN